MATNALQTFNLLPENQLINIYSKVAQLDALIIPGSVQIGNYIKIQPGQYLLNISTISSSLSTLSTVLSINPPTLSLVHLSQL